MNFSKPIVAGITAATLMLSPLSAFAQETAAPANETTPAEETPAAEAPAAETDGATAEVAAAVNSLPSQNWLKVCDDLDDGQKACLMRQIVVAGDMFQGSFLLRDDPGQESRLLAVASVPLGVLLPFGLSWQIDNAKPVRVPFMLCDPQSCSAQLVINEQYINSLKRGSTLKLTAKNRNNEDLNININLAGFTATYDSDEALTFEQVQQQESGQNALEKVLQDRAEQLRQDLNSEGATPPATDGAAPAAEGTPAAPAAPAQ